MPQKKALINTKEIDKKRDILKSKLNEAIEEKKHGRLSPAKKFLSEIENEIKTALENKLSYKKISSIIYEVYNFKISEQTIRAFVRNRLNIATNIQKTTTKSSSQIKEEMNSKNNDKGDATLWFLYQ